MSAVAAVASQFEAEFIALTGDGVGFAVQFPKSRDPDARGRGRRASRRRGEYERQVGQEKAAQRGSEPCRCRTTSTRR